MNIRTKLLITFRSCGCSTTVFDITGVFWLYEHAAGGGSNTADPGIFR